jgi:hypothetical protein
LQVPLLHPVFEGQDVQSLPARPQADGEVPVRQTEPSQQPLAQFIALQVGTPMHVTPLQIGVPPEQVEHAPPAWPHAIAVVPT